jgi:tRNA(Arg) A34 adenosine deaminase TadA
VFPTRLSQAVGATLAGSSRKFHLAAVGVRRDGAIVVSTNGGVSGARTYSAHAEARLARKLDRGAIVYVARTLRDGRIAIARPCVRCQKALANARVSKVYYTISETEWGCIDI